MVSSQSNSNATSEPEIVTPTASENNTSIASESEATSTTKEVVSTVEVAKKDVQQDPAEAFFDREGGADIVKWFMIWLESERQEGKLHTGK